jgi:hypothetical protein
MYKFKRHTFDNVRDLPNRPQQQTINESTNFTLEAATFVFQVSLITAIFLLIQHTTHSTSSRVYITATWCLGIVNLMVDRLKLGAQEYHIWSSVFRVFQILLVTGCIIAQIAVFVAIIHHLCWVLLTIVATFLVCGILENHNSSTSHAIASCLLL